LQDALQEQLKREEILWQQKSRELWLTCRDLNTKFFHASAVNHRRYNSISMLKMDDGSSLNTRDSIGNYFVDFFSKIFTTTNPVLDLELDDLVHPVITVDENEMLCALPDEREIYQAVAMLGSNKSPGPDGMNGLFYKTFWVVVKRDVINYVQTFFREGYLLKELNHTNIALIPKIPNPSRVNQFRPISLTNFNYKIISKILANRLKPLLEKIISPNQSAFIKGRSIHDNSILAHEIFHSLKQKKGNGGLMAIKLDMEKAFDLIEWPFLLKILTLLGFHPKWVHWISQCISTASFSILLDGSPFGKFASSRGLRQGDPLSPFLFILSSEILSRLILKHENLGNIHGIRISRNSPPISHLLFADDLIIFSHAKVSEATCILDILNKYSSWSGQRVNLAKSAFFLSKNTKLVVRNAIKDTLNLQLIPSHAKYLGLPLFIHKNKSLAFIDLETKIIRKISGWKAKLLSQAARTTLIKTVANAIPSYTMSIFHLPKSLCQNIDSAIRKFWWGFPQEKKHNLSLLSWKSICSPKSLGGLGIRSMEALNSSLLAKLGWRMLSSSSLLWVDTLKAKYLRNYSFLEAPFKSDASWIWKGILKHRKVVMNGACRAISSGLNLNVWSSPWIPSLPNFKPTPNPALIFPPNMIISDLILPLSRNWNIPLLHHLFDASSVQQILNIHLPSTSGLDRWIWAPSPSGQFSVKSAHEIIIQNTSLRPAPLNHADWDSLWSLKLQHRLKHLLWKISWNALPTLSNIGRFVSNVPLISWNCPMCKGPSETIEHLMLDCPIAKIIWRNSKWPLDISVFRNQPISAWVKAILYPHQLLSIPKHYTHEFQVTAAIIMDSIWYARNSLIHKNTIPDPSFLLKHISNTSRAHLTAWKQTSPSNLAWSPPPKGFLKANFDVAIRQHMAVAAATLSDHDGNIIAAVSKKLPLLEVNAGEAQAALLAIQFASSFGCHSLCLEGDSLTVILAINKVSLFTDWSFAPIIGDIHLQLHGFSSWTAVKVSRSANFRAHQLAKWAASNRIFGSIPMSCSFFSSVRINCGKDPPL
jgi:hypothetical protein